MTGEPRALLFLGAFARALAHQIRTPLSVVSNELVCIGAEHPELVSTANPRVKDITEILKAANRLGHTAPVFQRIALQDLNERLFAGQQSKMLGDAALLRAAFQGLIDIFDKYGVPASELRCRVRCIEIAVESIYFSCAWKSGIAPYSTDSLTAALCGKLGLDTIEAPLFDAVMDAHSISVAVAIDLSSLEINLGIPQRLSDSGALI
jgi:hypothetical protein